MKNIFDKDMNVANLSVILTIIAIVICCVNFTWLNLVLAITAVVLGGGLWFLEWFVITVSKGIGEAIATVLDPIVEFTEKHAKNN